MRHMFLELCGLGLYLLFVPIYVKEARRQRRSGNEDLARRYTRVIVVLAIPWIIVPWLTG